MDYLFIVVLGLCVGSFLNVCIYRIPREESICFPPSHCTDCNYKLKIYDLIPVFSFIFLKGKCRGCGQKISFQYPLIELINGILYILIYTQYGVSIDTIKYMLLASIMIIIGMIDFKTSYVYTATTVFAAVLGVIFIIINYFDTGKITYDNMIGAAIGFLVIGLIVVLTRGMGEGDIEIAAVAGLFLGIKAGIFMIFLSFILGGIVGSFYLIRKIKGKKEEMPFGPYLAIASIISIFVGNQIVIAYLSTFTNYV